MANQKPPARKIAESRWISVLRFPITFNDRPYILQKLVKKKADQIACSLFIIRMTLVCVSLNVRSLAIVYRNKQKILFGQVESCHHSGIAKKHSKSVAPENELWALRTFAVSLLPYEFSISCLSLSFCVLFFQLIETNYELCCSPFKMIGIVLLMLVRLFISIWELEELKEEAEELEGHLGSPFVSLSSFKKSRHSKNSQSWSFLKTLSAMDTNRFTKPIIAISKTPACNLHNPWVISPKRPSQSYITRNSKTRQCHSNGTRKKFNQMTSRWVKPIFSKLTKIFMNVDRRVDQVSMDLGCGWDEHVRGREQNLFLFSEDLENSFCEKGKSLACDAHLICWIGSIKSANPLSIVMSFLLLVCSPRFLIFLHSKKYFPSHNSHLFFISSSSLSSTLLLSRLKWAFLNEITIFLSDAFFW